MQRNNLTKSNTAIYQTVQSAEERTNVSSNDQLVRSKADFKYNIEDIWLFNFVFIFTSTNKHQNGISTSGEIPSDNSIIGVNGWIKNQ